MATRLEKSFWSTPHSAAHKERTLRECANVSSVCINSDKTGSNSLGEREEIEKRKRGKTGLSCLDGNMRCF